MDEEAKWKVIPVEEAIALYSLGVRDFQERSKVTGEWGSAGSVFTLDYPNSGLTDSYTFNQTAYERGGALG